MKSKQARINMKVYKIAENRKLDLGVERFDTNERELIETTAYKYMDKITEKEVLEFREYIAELEEK